MDNRNSIDSNSCILIEFLNEESALAVGYLSWLIKEVNEDELNHIIEQKEEIEIWWPKCEILSNVRKMKAAMKGLQKKDWTTFAIRILAFGGWTTMKEELDLLEKHNVKGTTKHNRHIFMKKSTDTVADVSIKIVGKTNKTNPENKKVRRKSEAVKRSKTILSEVQTASDVLKIDDDTDENMDSESVNSSADDIPLRKRTKFQLQCDTETLYMENKKLKIELAHYKDISNAKQESTELLEQLTSTRAVLAGFKILCSNCQNQVLKKQVKGQDTNQNLQKDVSSDNKIEKSSKSVKDKESSPLFNIGMNQNSASSELDDVQYMNVIDHTKKKLSDKPSTSLSYDIESEDKNIIVTNNDDSTEKILYGVQSIPITKSKDNNQIDSLSNNMDEDILDIEGTKNNDLTKQILSNKPSTIERQSSISSNALTQNSQKQIDQSPNVSVDNESKVDLGYNIYIFKSVLDEKVRKKDLRSLLLDLLNVLFDKKDFALCSRSGKKGKATDTAKPELDINKRHAIRKYAKSIFTEEKEEDIKKALDKIIANKCKNACKGQKTNES